MMERALFNTDSQPAIDSRLFDDPDVILLHAEPPYVAYGKDLEYMWYWEILRDEEFVQEGCSLTEMSAREASAYVVRFLQRQDEARTAGKSVDEVQKLLTDAGLASPHVVRAAESR